MEVASLVKQNDIWLLWAIVIGWAAISLYLDKKYKWANLVSPCIISLLGAMLLANFNVIPLESPVYDTIWDYVIPLAVPLLLFNANIKKIIRDSGKLFLGFHIAAIGTVLGIVIANLMFQGKILELEAVSAMLCGSYIGGGVNLAAMKTVYGASSEITGATFVADNLLMAIFFFVLAIIPTIRFFQNKYKHPVMDKVVSEGRSERSGAPDSGEKPESTQDTVFNVIIAIAIAFGIVAVSAKVSDLIYMLPMPDMLKAFFGQKYILITTFTLMLSSAFPAFFESVKGAKEIGEFFITIFFAAIGVPASIMMILQNAPLLFVYAAIVVFMNLSVTLVIGKLLGFNLEDLILSSNATIGGPTTAAALASSKRWDELVAPSILVGVWGYVIGNWIAPLVTNIMF